MRVNGGEERDATNANFLKDKLRHHHLANTCTCVWL